MFPALYWPATYFPALGIDYMFSMKQLIFISLINTKKYIHSWRALQCNPALDNGCIHRMFLLRVLIGTNFAFCRSTWNFHILWNSYLSGPGPIKMLRFIVHQITAQVNFLLTRRLASLWKTCPACGITQYLKSDACLSLTISVLSVSHGKEKSVDSSQLQRKKRFTLSGQYIANNTITGILLLFWSKRR